MLTRGAMALPEPSAPRVSRCFKRPGACFSFADSREQVVKTARMAGMSEIATGVLHNVGNVLNSVNVSANLAKKNAEQLSVKDLEMMVEVLRANENDIGRFVTDALLRYGSEYPDTDVNSISVRCDTSGLTGLKPTAFTVERREGAPFRSNIYYSTSPLKTADHLNVLTRMEQLLKSA